MEIMADATNVIAEGEVLQLMNAQDPDTTEERYLEVIYRKTARLFEAGGEVAAVLCGAPPAVQAGAGGLWQASGHRLPAHRRCARLPRRTRPRAARTWARIWPRARPTLPLIHALRNTQGAERELIRAAVTAGGRTPRRKATWPGSWPASTAAAASSTRASGPCEESRAAIEALAPVPASPYRDALAQLATVSVDRDR